MLERLPSDALEEGARDLNMFRKGTFVFEDESQMSVLMDYCLYNVYRRGRNGIQTYLS